MGWKARVPVLAAALWWGSLTAIGFVAAPLLFMHLPAPAMAGLMAAKLFTAQTAMSVACGILLLLAVRSGPFRAVGPEPDLTVGPEPDLTVRPEAVEGHTPASTGSARTDGYVSAQTDGHVPAGNVSAGTEGYVFAGLILAILGEFAVAPHIVARQDLAFWHTVGTAFYAVQWICALVALWKVSARTS